MDLASETISPFAPHPVPWTLMLQRWQWLTFIHWRYEPQVIRALLPQQVELDTFDGSAWVALAPFLLSGLRPPFCPPSPLLSRFPETNVRTYVRGPDGKRGVWFFTLEADRLVAVLGARAFFHLPYRWADMSVHRTATEVEYKSIRRPPFGSAVSDVVVEPGQPIKSGEFDNFLTARYRLYTVHRGQLFFAAIEHEPWPLQSARLVRLEQNLIERSGVPRQTGDPVVHFSEDLKVRVGRLKRCPK